MTLAQLFGEDNPTMPAGFGNANLSETLTPPDNPKPKRNRMEILKIQMQMAEDAHTLSPKAWKEKYADKTEFMPGQSYDGKDTFEYFKSNKDVFAKRMANTQKNIEEKAANEKLFSESVNSGLGYINDLSKSQDLYNNILKGFKEKYGYDYGDNLDPSKFVTTSMINEARRRIKDKDGIPLPGDPRNEMTCINGVCSIAANQGVSFEHLKGKEGTMRDDKGRTIPVQNKAFAQESYYSPNYEVIPADQRQPGDLAQYSNPEDGIHHMEFILGEADKQGNQETFNNYGLYLKRSKGQEYSPNEDLRNFRQFTTDKNGVTMNAQGDTVKFYRLKPEAAKKAAESNPEYQKMMAGKKAWEGSEDYQAFTKASDFINQSKNTNILGDDSRLISDIVKNKGNKEYLMKQVLPKAKNQRLVQSIIEKL